MCFQQVVWSDEETCIEHLKGALDQLSQPTNTIERVLERAATLLDAGIGMGVASEEEGEESEEEEVEFEDYYNDDQDADEQTDKQRLTMQ